MPSIWFCQYQTLYEIVFIEIPRFWLSNKLLITTEQSNVQKMLFYMRIYDQ